MLGSSEKTDGKEKPKIGDWVQWEHNGILGLPQSKKIVGFSDDGQFGFVEGSNTGLPISEIIPADAPDSSGRVPIRTLARVEPRKNVQGATMRQEVFSLTEGEVVLNWPSPLSPTSIQDLEDWLELVKRKISRSIPVVNVEDDEAK